MIQRIEEFISNVINNYTDVIVSIKIGNKLARKQISYFYELLRKLIHSQNLAINIVYFIYHHLSTIMVTSCIYEIMLGNSLLLWVSVRHDCLKMVREVASHQCLPHRNPDDRGQQVRTEFPLIGDQCSMDSSASNILSILCQFDMSQPLHNPKIESS